MFMIYSGIPVLGMNNLLTEKLRAKGLRVLVVSTLFKLLIKNHCISRFFKNYDRARKKEFSNQQYKKKILLEVF